MHVTSPFREALFTVFCFTKMTALFCNSDSKNATFSQLDVFPLSSRAKSA